MAFALMIDGKSRTLTREQGHAIWSVLNGEMEPNEEQAEFCSKIKRIYLNRLNAPKSYLEQYPLLWDSDKSVSVMVSRKARLPYKD